MDVKLWEYAVIRQAKEKDGETVEEAAVVVEPSTCLAKDQQTAQMLAARAIPEDAIGEIERLTVVVRPF